jgi:hypothetical protein
MNGESPFDPRHRRRCGRNRRIPVVGTNGPSEPPASPTMLTGPQIVSTANVRLARLAKSARLPLGSPRTDVNPEATGFASGRTCSTPSCATSGSWRDQIRANEPGRGFAPRRAEAPMASIRPRAIRVSSKPGRTLCEITPTVGIGSMPTENGEENGVSVGRGFVGFLDALGMQGIWLRQRPEDVVSRYDAWFRTLDARSPQTGLTLEDQMYEVDLPTFLDYPRPGLRTDFLTFSDTVAIVFDTRGRTDAEVMGRLGNTLARLFASALEHGFLFRGAVAFGDFYRGANSRLLIGEAVDEAAHWYTKADWAGIHLTPSTTRRPNPANVAAGPSIGEEVFFETYRVPLKDGGTTVATVLDWTAFSRGQLSGKMDDHFLRPPVTADVERKRQNTLAFRSAMEARRANQMDFRDQA